MRYTQTELKAIQHHLDKYNLRLRLAAWPKIYFINEKGVESNETISILLSRYKNKKKEEQHEIA